MHAVAVSSDGYALRFGTQAGRAEHPLGRATRGHPKGRDREIARLTGTDLIAATLEARGMLCRADEVNYLSDQEGVILIKLSADDRVLGATLHRP